MQHAAKAYLETQVTTTSQGQLLVMLYDGAVKFLVQAKERMAAKDYAGKGNLISKALDIINELDSTLNTEKGGELAGNLHQLYFYCSKRLFMANSKMEQAPIDEVIKILGGLRSAYAQIMDQPEALAAAAQAAAAQRQSVATPARNPLSGSTVAPNAGQVGSVRAHGAYVQQGALSAGPIPPTTGPAVPETPPAAMPGQPESPHDPAPLPVVEPVAAKEPENPAAVMPPPAAARRLAASALYSKFAAHSQGTAN